MDTENIDKGLKNDCSQSHKVRAGDQYMMKSKNNMVRRKCRHNAAKILRKAYSESSNGATDAYSKDHPAIEKGNELTIRFAKKDILPPSLGKHSPHLGKSKAAQHADDHANNPDQQKERRDAGIESNLADAEKNPRADNPARQKQNGIQQGEIPNEFGRRGQGCESDYPCNSSLFLIIRKKRQ